MEEKSAELFLERRWLNEQFMYRRKLFFLSAFFLPIIIVLLYSLFLLLPPIQGILNRYEQILAAQVEGMQKIPELQSKLTKLENQIGFLTSESVDARLKNIENAIHSGKIRPGDVASLNDVKSELQQLKTYMFRDPRELVELKELQTNYHKLSEAQNSFASKEMLESDLNQVKNMFYMSLGFFGILFTVLFGSWWFIGRKSMKPPSQTPTTPVIQNEKEPNPDSPTNN